MTQEKTVIAIILNYNGGAMLGQCISSILRGTVVPMITLVDNASTDESLTDIRLHYPDITIIENEKNIGFAAGMNVGLRKGLEEGKEFFWLLNNDAIVEETALEELLLVARNHPEQGLWSPAIYSPDQKTPWFLGGDISYLTMRAKHRNSAKTTESYGGTGYLTGCALLLSRRLIERCGILDERYFLYYEDTAYSLQAKRQGFEPTIAFRSHIYHAEKSQENPDKIYWLVRSGVFFFLHESPWYWQLWIRFYLLLRIAKNELDMVIAPTPVARRVKQAYTDAFRENHA